MDAPCGHSGDVRLVNPQTDASSSGCALFSVLSCFPCSPKWRVRAETAAVMVVEVTAVGKQATAVKRQSPVSVCICQSRRTTPLTDNTSGLRRARSMSWSWSWAGCPGPSVRLSVTVPLSASSTDQPINRYNHEHKISFSRNFPGIRSRGAALTDLSFQ